MTGCLIVHVFILLDLFIWVEFIDASWSSRHPLLALLLLLVIFAVTAYIVVPIVEKIESIHIQKEIDKTPISELEQPRPATTVSTKTIPARAPQAPNSTISYTAQQIYSMNWREFEIFIAKVLREHDYITRVTPAQNDGGKDIIATRGKVMFYIECKHWKRQSVGREVLQKLVGAAAANHVREVIFITTSNYADTAIQYKYELNNAGAFHLQLWSMRDVLSLANHAALLSTRSLRNLLDRHDRITCRENYSTYFSFGHPSNHCSISISNGKILTVDQNKYSHAPCQYFEVSNGYDLTYTDLFFEEIRSPDRPDLICFYTDKKNGTLKDFIIIGCVDGRLREIFTAHCWSAIDSLGEHCTIKIKDIIGETYLVVTGTKSTVTVKWAGSTYVVD